MDPSRRSILAAGATGAVTLLAASRSTASLALFDTEGKQQMAGNAGGGQSDFDFLIGSWNVRHRRLKARVAGSNEWIEFPGTCTVRKILGGAGNFDENVIELPAGTYRASTLRLYDPKLARWSIYWIDARNPGIEPPVHGGFENGRGVFFGDDAFEGRPIRVRFVWSAVSADECHWEQAFSADGEKSWETNWRMVFTRRAA